MARGSRESGKMLRQIAAVDQLHTEEEHAVLIADLVDRHDVRMIEVRGQLGLAAEPGSLRGRRQRARENHLQRHEPLQLEVPGLVNDPHATPGNFLQQEVVAHAFFTRRYRPSRRGLAWRVGAEGVGIPCRGHRRIASGQLGIAERFHDHVLQVREPRKVFGGAGAVAAFAAELDLQREQLAEECGSIFRAACIHKVFKPGLATPSPVGLEALARLVDASSSSQWRVKIFTLRRVGEHQATST